jgi:glycosyltransferase involved in cell wall biosynthesis
VAVPAKSRSPIRICLVYDCLFPYTVGGAERWYRNVAERLSANGHEVTYLTLRQWRREEHPNVPGVEVRAVGPRMRLYSRSGRRRILPPLVFGIGVLWHLLRNRKRYGVVHTASFPYFSLLAAAAARPFGEYRIVVDWHEVWSRAYWCEYLGRVAGRVGWSVQRACARVPQRAFCFSELHARRLREAGLGGEVTLLSGEYAGDIRTGVAIAAQPLVVFAGRLIPEKRVGLAVAAVAAAAERVPGLRAVFYGEGPERPELLRAIERHGLEGAVSAPGFVDAADVEADLQRALCMLLPSRREGYGMVVVEASAHATPSIVVAGEDNAAAELIEDGVNGVIVHQPDPGSIADAIVRVHEAGFSMRRRTAEWYAANADRLSIEGSLSTVLEGYGEVQPEAVYLS